MAKQTYTIQYWDRGVIGGWEAAVVISGKRTMVPCKLYQGSPVNFDSKEQAKRHAIALATKLFKVAA